MTKNMGPRDRAFRLIVGVVILGLFGAITGPWRWVTLLGLIPLGTALTGNCPAYTLFGYSTCPTDSDRRAP